MILEGADTERENVEMGLKDKKLFLLDMDGTLYIDDRLLSGAAEFLQGIKDRGGQYIFMTNNSSKGVGDYIDKLRRMGITAKKEEFLTSADASAELLSDRKREKMYVMGTESFKDYLRTFGFNVTEEAEDDDEIVLCGFDRELTYKKLKDVCRLLSQGSRSYFATNPDWVCPADFGYVPDCGSMCWMIERATGRWPVFIGKPEPKMALMAMKRTGFTCRETVVIGDRLYTDIACGINAGTDTCLVLSGEGTEADIEKTGIRPTYVFRDIEELHRRIKDET